MKPIQMVDLVSQYEEIESEVLEGIKRICGSAHFINGEDVAKFRENLKTYSGSKHVIPCANGTDAIQIALMALGLKPGDEVIVPTWTFVATAEVIALMGLKPVFIDVYPDTFNINIDLLASVLTPNTKAIVPVHLYGQCCDMEPILKFAKNHNLYVVEDTAQAIGAKYTFPDSRVVQAGTMGDFGTLSFFPSKNLGCYGDGGAIYTQDAELAKKAAAICDHGQINQKYHHDILGVNSRLDSIQAHILNVKLAHLDRYETSRNQVANRYNDAFQKIEEIKTPATAPFSTHVFHQYTMQVPENDRDKLKNYLQEKGVPSMIYYPIPLHRQGAYKQYLTSDDNLKVSDALSRVVLSLPIHSEMEEVQLEYIIESIYQYFHGK